LTPSSNDADNSKGTKANSASVKAQIKRRHKRRKEVLNESPIVEKSLPKKVRLGLAKSPKVNDGSSPGELKSPAVVHFPDVKSPSMKKPKGEANSPAADTAASDVVQQSPVVESVDPAHLLDIGDTLSNINSESTLFNHEVPALLQHVYSEVLLDVNF
jgi:hypothetical protein